MSEIIGIGTDLCAVPRMKRAIEKPHFYGRVYLDRECAYLDERGKARAQSAAAMFAAKEAVAKALGTGFAGGVMPWTIEVTHEPSGAPGIVLHGAALERLHALGGKRIMLSLTHEDDMALAFVIIS